MVDHTDTVACFGYAESMRRAFPARASGVLCVEGIACDADVHAAVAHFNHIARGRLADDASEGSLPEIQAWRQAFSAMGLKPTQYRCASEALLRRFRKEGALPGIHPLFDLCNAVSLACAIPIAVFDLDQVDGALEVRHARGDETYQTFGGEIEQPELGEVIFADASNRAHARRWTNRQSGLSAVRDATTRVLIVAEALHANAAADVAGLVAALDAALRAAWPSATIRGVPVA